MRLWSLLALSPLLLLGCGSPCSQPKPSISLMASTSTGLCSTLTITGQANGIPLTQQSLPVVTTNFGTLKDPAFGTSGSIVEDESIIDVDGGSAGTLQLCAGSGGLSTVQATVGDECGRTASATVMVQLMQ